MDYDDGRLFPLTEEVPKCLLPIANRKILGYQLDLLQNCGATEVYIAAPQEYQTPLSLFIAEEYNPSVTTLGIEIVPVPDMLGSADALRAITDRIRGDFIVINSDVVSQINVGVLVNSHRLKTADVTMMLTAVPIEETIEANKKLKGGKNPAQVGSKIAPKIDEEDQEYIGLCADGRVAIKTPALEVDEENLTLTKPLLKKCCGSGGRMRLRSDLIDTGIYCMSYWILEFLAAKKHISTIRTDLIPYLVRRQYQDRSYLRQHVPGLEHRKRGLQVLEPWLVQTKSIHDSFMSPSLELNPASDQEAKSCIAEMSSSCFLSPVLSTRPTTSSAVNTNASSDDSVAPSVSLSHQSSIDAIDESPDLLRCYSVLVDSPPEDCQYPVICQRITNSQAYMSINSFMPFVALPTQSTKSSAVFKWFCGWNPYAGPQALSSNTILKKEQSILGEGVECGEKVTLKSCTIGKMTKIGAKSKLNQCVIMQNVQIGDNCTIQNSIISDNVVIENGCSLKHCYVGANVKLKESTAIKSETISSSTITE